MKHIPIIPILLLFALYSCESDVDFKGKETKSKLVLNSIINCTSDTAKLELAESVFLFSGNKSQSIENAQIQVAKNTNPLKVWFDKKDDKKTYYNYLSPLKPGDKIEIEGYVPAFGNFSGYDIIPEPVQIVSVNSKWFTGEIDKMSYLQLFVKIKDIPNDQNYYRIVIKSKTIFTSSGNESELTWDKQTVLVDKEILFNDISGIGGEDEDSYKYRIFTNDLFKSKEYTLNVYIRKDNFHNAPDLIKDLVKVEIHSLSHNLYSYMKSLELALVEDNYQEPVKIYTNISGGYGIVGAYNVTEKVIETENN